MKKILFSIIILFSFKILFAQNLDTNHFAKWIRENAIELKGTENPDFTQLIHLLNNKTVVAKQRNYTTNRLLK